MIRLSNTNSWNSSGSDDWLGRPDLLNMGTYWVLIYRSSTSHSFGTGDFHIRFSDDEGDTWSDEDETILGAAVTGFPLTSPNTENLTDASLIAAPNGNILIHATDRKQDISVRYGTYQWTSTDDGDTWTFDGLINADTGLMGANDYTIVGGDIYIPTWEDAGALGAPYKSSLFKSTDNGSSWSKVGDITSTTDGTNECSIEYITGNTLISILRDDSLGTTYQRISTDLGSTWGTLTDMLSTFHVLHRPRMYSYNGNIFLIARHYVGPDREQTVIYYTEDGGSAWVGPLVPDPNQWYHDGGYCSMLQKADGTFYMYDYIGTTEKSHMIERAWAL